MRSLLENVVRGAELLAARSDSLPLTDGEIVRRLTHDRDQSAFVLLVRRHAPLVWGVCRQMLPNDQDAEDAFQATFLALVRSLDKVRKQQSLGPWLHGVAYRIAMKVRREAVRRKQREARAGLEEQAQPVADSTWNRLQGIVHEEIASLPDHLREAFVLCCLEGRSQHEAAEQLGWKLGTLSARVTQARQRLLDRLTRRDIALSMAAGMLGSQMASRPALALSQSTVSLLSARIESIPTTISTLAHGVVPMMWTRTKLAVLGIVFGGLVTTGIGWMATSEAQTPAIQAEVDYLLKALRDEKTEYRFVQIVKPLTIDEMKKVLATSEYEGWSYCGTQDLMTKEGKPQPHMVFKRGKTSVTQEQDLRRKLEETLAREEAERRKQFKPEEIESVTAQLKLMELKLVELQQAKAKALQTGNPAQAKLIEQEIMANDVAIKKIRHYADAMKQAAESSNHKSAITEDEVGIARMKAEIEAKVRGEVQDQLKAVERERALATQAAHEQKRYRELNDNIASAEKRILEIKAVLDIANKAGSKSDIQRYTNEIKATEELKKKLEEIRSKEQSEQLKRHSIPTKQESRTVSDAEDRIARIRAERKSLDENLKPHHDLDLSRKKQAESLEAELQQQRQIDNEKRQGMLRERIHREEIQRQKLADTQLQMKSRVDAVEEEIGEIRKSLKETGGDLTPLKERLKSLQTSKDDLISKTTDLTRQLKELDLVRETFLREVTQNEIDSIRKNTERLTPPTEGVKNAVVKTYNFPPTLTWKHASEFMKIFDGEKGTINIKQDGNQYSLIINASASAHEKAAEYIKKNSLPVK